MVAARLEVGIRMAGGRRAAGAWAQGLAELTDRLATVEDIHELSTAGRYIADLLGADDVSLMRVIGEPSALVELLSAHPENAPGESWALADFPATAHVLETGRIGQVVTGDPLGDPRELAELARLGVGTLLLVPLDLGRGRRALMEVYRVRPQAFSRAEIERAQVVALQLGSVIARVAS
jgi:GAF domain-containing protein